MNTNRFHRFLAICELIGKYVLAFILGIGSALFIIWFVFILVSNHKESAKNYDRYDRADILPAPNIIIILPEESEVDTSSESDFSSHTDPVNEEELYLLAHLIFAEAGSDWCSDKMQLYVGSVVLNRVAHHKYPDSMKKVIYQSGQYSCTWDGNFDKEPNQRAWNNAKLLLTEGSKLPYNVIFQAQFKQGDGVYEKVQNMYFCYIED